MTFCPTVQRRVLIESYKLTVCNRSGWQPIGACDRFLGSHVLLPLFSHCEFRSMLGLFSNSLGQSWGPTLGQSWGSTLGQSWGSTEVSGRPKKFQHPTFLLDVLPVIFEGQIEPICCAPSAFEHLGSMLVPKGKFLFAFFCGHWWNMWKRSLWSLSYPCSTFLLLEPKVGPYVGLMLLHILRAFGFTAKKLR